ncbi:MAG: YHYH protein [Chitinophagales bacterium]|nr:YHYH protein [Chitinophagaceae bacterium]MCB9065907.1 YHYH protein [Chitinophagales bacterium]
MKKKNQKIGLASMALVLIVLLACNKSDTVNATPVASTSTSTGTVENPANTGNGTVTSDVPDIYKKIYGATDIYMDGDYVVIQVTGLPDHKSPYYLSTQWESSMYEAYNGTNSMFNLNPNRISQSNMTFRIPVNPQEATSKRSTPMGPMGISLNGVPFYNQYAAGGSPLTGEINSFDQYNGHPQQMGGYHYHVEPLWLTSNKGKDVLLGFLLDGFPVYGPMEEGRTLTSSDLDAYHGHTHATADYPEGIYHYHVSADAPYLNGDGFFGNAGTVSQ